jgi:hypothetical protein
MLIIDASNSVDTAGYNYSAVVCIRECSKPSNTPQPRSYNRRCPQRRAERCLDPQEGPRIFIAFWTTH